MWALLGGTLWAGATVHPCTGCAQFVLHPCGCVPPSPCAGPGASVPHQGEQQGRAERTDMRMTGRTGPPTRLPPSLLPSQARPAMPGAACPLSTQAYEVPVKRQWRIDVDNSPLGAKGDVSPCPGGPGAIARARRASCGATAAGAARAQHSTTLRPDSAHPPCSARQRPREPSPPSRLRSRLEAPSAASPGGMHW